MVVCKGGQLAARCVFGGQSPPISRYPQVCLWRAIPPYQPLSPRTTPMAAGRCRRYNFYVSRAALQQRGWWPGLPRLSWVVRKCSKHAAAAAAIGAAASGTAAAGTAGEQLSVRQLLLVSHPKGGTSPKQPPIIHHLKSKLPFRIVYCNVW